MHMADALVSPSVALSMYAASTLVAAYSIKKVREENNPRKIPLMGIMGAFVFAAQMLNFAIPGTGSSGHLCGSMLLAALLGPEAAFLTMIGILAMQCLLFADGGLLALGANIWNMAFYGCFVGYYLLWKPIMQSNLFGGNKSADRIKIALGSILGCVITLQLGAFSVVLETSMSGITELPFRAFAGIMQPIHLAIGLVEGLITTTVLLFIYESRPELIMELDISKTGDKNKCSLRTTVSILAIVTVIIGGGLSLLASTNPDGLEWSLFGNTESGYSENMGLDEEHYGISSKAADTAEAIQEKTAFLPDYAFVGSDSAAGTTLSGLAGSAIVAAAAVLICTIGGFFRKKRPQAKDNTAAEHFQI